jgi:hypothetical protein
MLIHILGVMNDLQQKRASLNKRLRLYRKALKKETALQPSAGPTP